MERVYTDIGKAYKEKRIVYLTNSLGEETGYGEIPPDVGAWYENLDCNSPILLYLARYNGNFGVLGVYEYDECFRNDKEYTENMYWKTVQRTANKLATEGELKRTEVLLGKHTGFEDCHEIALWFPYPLDKQEVQKQVAFGDSMAYADFN